MGNSAVFYQGKYRRGLISVALAQVLLVSQASATEQTCALKQGVVRTVIRVNGADSVTLDDGRDVKLAGILPPRASDGNAAPGKWPPEYDAEATLSAMILGQAVELAFGATRTDRYGRHVAHLFVGKDEKRVWVQGALLASGHARAHATPRMTDCLPELLAHERVARQSRLGLWRIGLYRPKPAARVALLMHLRSTFQLVAGRVASVSRTKSGIYLNFGENWHNDFTIHVSNAVAAANPQWAASLDDLKDTHVEVRGWVERRNGPMIAISHPAEIEIVPESLTRRFQMPRSGAQSVRRPQDAVPGIPGTDEVPAPNEERPEPKAPGAVDL